MRNQFHVRYIIDRLNKNKGDSTMNNLQILVDTYLEYCKKQKRLDSKTIKAYQIDLRQFSEQNIIKNASDITSDILENYIATLHQKYKPKTVKRKITSLKVLFHYFEYKDIITVNPFNKIQLRFREPTILPKTIPLHTIETFLSAIYNQYHNGPTTYQRDCALRDAAIIELLFATGMRISELCALKINDVDLYDRTVLIYGKGAKERIIQIGNDDVIQILNTYKNTFSAAMQVCNHFFANPNGTALSDQAVRRMIKKYTTLAGIELHITPHMFRHTFATSLLEADVDIRYIQEMLGHSSINITKIYTHVAMSKQRDILTTKHPRKDFKI